MTDREYAALSKKIRKMAELWVGRLQLNFWHISVCVERVGQGETGAYAGSTVGGQADSFSEYMDATLTFFAPVLMDCSDAEIEKTVVHELLHLYTSRTMSDDYSTFDMELLTTNLTRLMLIAWDNTHGATARSVARNRQREATPAFALMSRQRDH